MSIEPYSKKTTHLQYSVMVRFMEIHGDLSRASGGPRNRQYTQMKWKELTKKLNRPGLGMRRSEVKWRKVWSDYKNNCKRKLSKIKSLRTSLGFHLSLTDMESRVMAIIKSHTSSFNAVEDDGKPQDNVSDTSKDEQELTLIVVPSEVDETDWTTPGTSGQETVAPESNHSSEADPPPQKTEEQPESPSFISVNSDWRPPPQKEAKSDMFNLFLKMYGKTREYTRERDKANDALERERLRVREMELKERVRQRDVELHLQAQWLEFMKEAMGVFVRYMEKDK